MMQRRPTDPGKIEKAKNPRSAVMRLAAYLLPFKVQLVSVLVFVVIYTLLGLAGPYLIHIALDNYIIPGKAAGLGWVMLILAVSYLFNNVFQAIANWIMSNVSQRALKSMRKDLFTQLQLLPLSFYDRNQSGELMSRLTNDIDAINQAVSQNVTSLIASVLSMVGILLTMFLMDFWLALASLVVVPIMFAFTNFVARYTRRGYQQLQKNLGELNAVMEESISGEKVIKAFRRNESVLDNFRTRNQAVFKAGVTANSYALLLMPITNVLGNLFVIVIAGLGGLLALQGKVSVGVIAAFILYAQNFINPLRNIANMYNSIQAALAGSERVFEVIDTTTEIGDVAEAYSLKTINGDVNFEQVNFSYIPGKPVIKDMSLQAKAGQIIALVGPTGAGKTTLINLLSRFYEIDEGSITIDGKDIRQICKDDLRQQLGIVLQDTFLFSDSVMENIRFGRLDATDEEVVQAAHMADADHFIRQLPEGYQTILSERAGNLSQGQRQLLSIARAILSDPGILILDEATSSVDTRTEARIQKALLRLMEGRTSFVIAHRLSTIREADNVIVINEGEIVEQGSHQQLLDKKGFFYKLYTAQFKGQEI
ncbi:MAG: multidrug ABC transporter ATP-binding protein [Anaerolineales bacterium]|nr:MAG: multidrug ABC transporter ATP-binding protein [Anaerolineales bacterium]